MGLQIRQAVIFAGGYGKRLAPFTDTAPKPMYPIAGKPYIEHLILQIRNFGIHEVVLLLGYLPEKIMDYFGDGSRYGMTFRYVVTDVECETQKRILAAKDLLDERFLMMYCDNYCPIDFQKLVMDAEDHDAMIQITAYANKDGYTKNNLRIAENGCVLSYDKKRTLPDLAGVDIGYAILDKRILELTNEENDNFEAVVYPQVVAQGKMYATVTEHRYYSIGSFERIALTEEFFKHKKFVFLDRDGTINVRPPKACYVERPEDFIWLPGAIEAVKQLNNAGYLVILISNQPGIARGRLTEEILQSIHNKMILDLANAGAHIDKIYYCPHNWDEGCECRKPKPGMLYQAQKDFSLNLRTGYLIGDDERDIEAGNAAGCHSILVGDEYMVLDAVKDIIHMGGRL
ncbi:MAG: HAD-IIIA family hydrolase [Lachnospiraceae bacterium]|nr:HAD-IIIA family hydrolase [Lachnospiraceae bacterium]